jgi:hypothetical protein
MSPIQTPTTISGWAIWLVITLAIIAVVFVAANAFGIAIPSWVITGLWICGAAAFLVAVIMFLGRLGGGAQ